MKTVRAYITVLSHLSGSLVTTEEIWTLAADSRGPLPEVIRPCGERLRFFPNSGRVATTPALRHSLGIGCVSGEGIMLDRRDFAA